MEVDTADEEDVLMAATTRLLHTAPCTHHTTRAAEAEVAPPVLTKAAEVEVRILVIQIR